MFSDIANHWASQCIVVLARRGMVSGYPNGTFRPKATIARAEFAALLPKVFPELIERQAVRSFRDLPMQHWAHEAVNWSTQRELLSNLFSPAENRLFRPRAALSRAEVIGVLMRGLEATQGVEVAIPDLLEEADDDGASQSSAQISYTTSRANPEADDIVAQTFSDAAVIAPADRGAIAAALKRQLLEPLGEPRMLSPNAAITRGEVAALLCRALEIPEAELGVSNPALNASSQSIFQTFLQQEAGYGESQLAFLDRGIQNSPYRASVAQYPQRLQQPEGVVIPPSRQAMSAAKIASYPTPYPKQGELFFVDEGGLEFLPADILAGCVCLATTVNGELHGRWLGRDALSDRQLWSATKFIPLLNLADRINAIDPQINIGQCNVSAADSRDGKAFPRNRKASPRNRKSSYLLTDLATSMMTYDNRMGSSNALAVMFKRFETPARLEQWTQQMTGSQSLSFQGRYGEAPFIEQPELWRFLGKPLPLQRHQVLLQSAGVPYQGENLMSVYDLTRLLSMAAWHWQLPTSARIPNIQTPSLESILRILGVDTARYVEVALETLGLMEAVKSPVILSKCGFGRSDERDRTELTYCALVQFSLPRSISNPTAPDPSATYQRYSACFTLIAAQADGDVDAEARYVDALMASTVTEIIRRLVLGKL